MSHATHILPAEPAAAARNTAGTITASIKMRSKHARASKAMALATFAMAAGSGLQALLYLRSFGVNARTDGFFAAFALYAIFGVFSQSIRVTSAPLLVGKRPAVSVTQFAAALGLIAVPVIVITGPLAALLASVLAPSGGAASRDVMVEALPVLGGAMVVQLWAAGGATLLAVRDRFTPVAVAYAGGAAAGLISYIALQGATGDRVLGFSMLTMAIATFSIMVVPMVSAWREQVASSAHAPAGSLRPRALTACVGSLLGRTGIYLAFNGLYLVTLAFAGRYQTGDATVVSYAYLFCSYLVAGTGFAIGMARVADMARGANAGWDILGETVPQGFRYAILISAPALAGLIACGAPLVGALLPSSLSGNHVLLLQRFALLMAPWLIAAQLVNLLLPVAFAQGRSRAVNALAPVLVIAQIVFTAAGAALFGLYGTVGAMFLAPAAFAVTMLVGGTRRGKLRPLALELLRDGARFGLLAAAAFGGGWLIAHIAPDQGAVRPLIAGVIGSVAYAAGLCVLAREQVAKLLNRSGPTASSDVSDTHREDAGSTPAESSGRTPARSSRVSRRRRWLSSGTFAVVLLLLFGGVSMARQWNGHILWETDGLFYQAKVLEIRGESSTTALKQVFNGPLGVWSRETQAQQPGDTAELQASPQWPIYSAKFYARRLALPYVAAALYPLLHDRSLQFLSLLGYVLLGPLLYALLRRRFRHSTSLVVALACMAIPPVRDWAIFPMNDSWGLTLEVAALLTAVLTLERGNRWLPAWVAIVFLLSITRDTAFIPVLAAGALLLVLRNRQSLILVLTGLAAAIPAALAYPIDERQQLAYVMGNHTIPKDSSWSFVTSHYLPNLGHMLHQNLQYAVHNPLTILIFVVGLVLLFVYGRRGDPWFVVVKGAALGYLALLAVGPAFSGFRYELVLVPLVAGGLALGLERAVALVRERRAARVVPDPPDLGLSSSGLT